MPPRWCRTGSGPSSALRQLMRKWMLERRPFTWVLGSIALFRGITLELGQHQHLIITGSARSAASTTYTTLFSLRKAASRQVCVCRLSGCPSPSQLPDLREQLPAKHKLPELVSRERSNCPHHPVLGQQGGRARSEGACAPLVCQSPRAPSVVARPDKSITARQPCHQKTNFATRLAQVLQKTHTRVAAVHGANLPVVALPAKKR